MKKNVVIDLKLCDPKKCNPKSGICLAINACKHNIIEQEEPFDSPIVFFESMCIGCSDCINACPLKAIKISRGDYD